MWEHTFPEWINVHQRKRAAGDGAKAVNEFPRPPVCANFKPQNAARDLVCDVNACEVSAYDAGLKAWLDAYGKDNVIVVEQQDVLNDPAVVIPALFDFVGVDRYRAPPINVQPIPVAVLQVPAPAECHALRALFEPYVDCLAELMEEVLYPYQDVRKQWVGCTGPRTSAIPAIVYPSAPPAPSPLPDAAAEPPA